MSRPAARSTVRVLILEDHVLFAESLELALSIEGYDVRRIPVPEAAVAATSLLATVARFAPRVILLDLDLGQFGDGVRLIQPMAREGANVVVVTASTDRARWGECIRHGARKVLSKTRPLNDILAAVRRISQGLPVMDQAEREDLLAEWRDVRLAQQGIRDRLNHLTVRERQVLGHLMKGRTVRDIALLSVVSEATVRTQVKSILAKMEVSSQLSAVGVAHQVQWQPPSHLT